MKAPAPTNAVKRKKSPRSIGIDADKAVTGSGFGATQGGSTAAFSNYGSTYVNASVVSWSDTQITVTVSSATISGPVKVTVGGVASNTNFYFNMPPPKVTGISPTSGAVGTQVTINGSGFQTTRPTSSSVSFNGIVATINNWSDTQIVATVAAGSATGPVSVAVNAASSNQDVLLKVCFP